MKKAIITLFILVGFLGLYTPTFAVSPCNPTDTKPEKKETRLGGISVSPDIVPVGGLMTIMVNNSAGNKDVSIATPGNATITDYFPKENYVSPGQWTTSNGEALPAGQYSLIVKINNWTAGKWIATSYSITSGAGTGDGNDYFFGYYDTVDMTMALDTRNMTPQSTAEVVRKVDVAVAPDLQVTLATNKGKLGTTISQEIGQTVTAKADSRGIATFYLFAEEGDNVKFTATCLDTCKSSSITQNFTIDRSDVARTYTDYAWIWYTLGAILVILLIIILIRKRHNKPQPPIDTPEATTINVSSSPMTAHDKADFFKNTNIDNAPTQSNDTLNTLNNRNDEQPK